VYGTKRLVPPDDLTDPVASGSSHSGAQDLAMITALELPRERSPSIDPGLQCVVES
jgi:hypothetical protein